ncbi:MAG TPA: hypothetical protein ACFYD1_00560 [Candidatus Hypogeohydataceae bacterium YC38]|nr:hypothetical protein [Candidatus Brocadiales bacterium]
MITTLVRPTTVISQESLSKVVRLRRELQELESWASETKARLASEEDQIIASLEDGVPVEAGERVATVKTTSRRIVAWKEAFIARLGKAVADRVQAEVVPQVYKKLEIA